MISLYILHVSLEYAKYFIDNPERYILFLLPPAHQVSKFTIYHMQLGPKLFL